jgi:hypothetical protein
MRVDIASSAENPVVRLVWLFCFRNKIKNPLTI